MTLLVQPEAPPLRQEPDGAIRIGDSRVLLELVVHAFEAGATPESIVQRYPTLSLQDAYTVIAYFLRHTDEVHQYLDGREQEAQDVRKQIECVQGDLGAIRSRLRAPQQ